MNKIDTRPLGSTIQEIKDDIGLILLNTVDYINIDIDKEEITVKWFGSPSEELTPEKPEPNFLEKIDILTTIHKDTLQECILTAMQYLSKDRYYASGWLMRKGSVNNILELLEWGDLVSIKDSFLGLPVVFTDDIHFRGKLMLLGNRFKDQEANKATVSVLISLGSFNK